MTSAAWTSLAVGTSFAAAALVGAVLLAGALRLDSLAISARPLGRLAMAGVVLLAVLVASLFLLVPGQSDTLVGIELSVVGLALGIAHVVWLSQLPAEPDEARTVTAGSTALGLLVAGCLVVCGLILEIGASGAVWWYVGAAVVALPGAVAVTGAELVRSARPR